MLFQRLFVPAMAVAVLVLTLSSTLGAPDAQALHAPPSTPTLITPPDGAVIRPNVATQFAVRLSDPDIEPLVGEVTIRQNNQVVTTFTTSPTVPFATSTSTGTPGILPPGTYTWSARARDPVGLWSPESAERTFTVVAGGTLGGGPLRGGMSYDDSGVVPATWPCTPIEFDLSASSPVAATANLGIIGYVGPVSVTGRGESDCETVAGGSGSMSLDLSGFQSLTESEIDCMNLRGAYVRTATDLRVTVEGSCTMNAFTTDPLVLTFVFEAVPPTGPAGVGVTRPLHRWSLEGAFAVTST